MRPQSPPRIVYQGIERAVTPQLIAQLVQDGLTPADYEALDLVRAYYRFPTIGVLLNDAFGRCDPQPERPPRTGPFFRKGGA